MPNWTYLSAYTSSIPAAQKQNLLNLIYGSVLTNQIQTLDQYQAALSQELQQLSAGLPTPIFNLITEPKQGLTHSANYNAMEQQAIAALGILYKEALLLETTITNYGNVITGNLDAIEATITSLEKQVDTLELLASNSDGYVLSVYDSFSEQNSYRLNRDSTTSITPFIVADLGFIPATYDAQIVNGILQLPVNKNSTFNLIGASLTNENPMVSGAISSYDIPGNEDPYDVTNLLGGNSSQYWANTVDLPTLSQNQVSTDLILNIGGTQQVNNITINPFTRFPYNITSIQYTKNIGSGVYFEMLDDVSQYPININALTAIQFSNKYADSIKISITQNNYSSLRYVEQGANKTITSIFDLATGQQIQTSAMTDPNSYYFAMTSLMQRLLELGVTPASDANTIDVYEFLYGMKSISIGQTQYSNEGIYVTQPYTIPSAGAIGLSAIDNAPELTSIEYDVLVEYDNIPTSGSPQFVSNFTQNLLPSEYGTISNEVLDLVDNQSNSTASGVTRFGVADITTVRVYQNNILLDSSSYVLTRDTNTLLTTITFLDSTISPAQRNISFYTISYQPSITAYTINLQNYSQAIINLRILLRSASPNAMLTPSVSSYSMQFKQYT